MTHLKWFSQMAVCSLLTALSGCAVVSDASKSVETWSGASTEKINENIQVSRQILTLAPKISWQRPIDTANLSALDRLLTDTRLLKAYHPGDDLDVSVVDQGALTPIKLDAGFFHNKTLLFSSIVKSKGQPMVSRNIVYFGKTNDVLVGNGAARTARFSDDGFCIGEAGPSRCWRPMAGPGGQGYLLRGDGVVLQLILLERGDALNLQRTALLNALARQQRAMAGASASAKLNACVEADRDMHDRLGGEFNPITAAQDCATMSAFASGMFSQTVFGNTIANVEERSKVMAHVKRLINTMGNGVSFEEKSKDFFAYFSIYSASNTSISPPPTGRPGGRFPGAMSWSDTSMSLKNRLAGKEMSGHESVIPEKLLADAGDARTQVLGRTVVAVAPEYRNDSDLTHFIGYRLYFSPDGRVFMHAPDAGVFDVSKNLLTLPVGKSSERFKFANSKDGAVYLVATSGSNAGLVLRVVGLMDGDPLGLVGSAPSGH